MIENVIDTKDMNDKLVSIFIGVNVCDVKGFELDILKSSIQGLLPNSTIEVHTVDDMKVADKTINKFFIITDENGIDKEVFDMIVRMVDWLLPNNICRERKKKPDVSTECNEDTSNQKEDKCHEERCKIPKELARRYARSSNCGRKVREILDNKDIYFHDILETPVSMRYLHDVTQIINVMRELSKMGFLGDWYEGKDDAYVYTLLFLAALEHECRFMMDTGVYIELANQFIPKGVEDPINYVFIRDFYSNMMCNYPSPYVTRLTHMMSYLYVSKLDEYFTGHKIMCLRYGKPYTLDFKTNPRLIFKGFPRHNKFIPPSTLEFFDKLNSMNDTNESKEIYSMVDFKEAFNKSVDNVLNGLSATAEAIDDGLDKMVDKIDIDLDKMVEKIDDGLDGVIDRIRYATSLLHDDEDDECEEVTEEEAKETDEESEEDLYDILKEHVEYVKKKEKFDDVAKYLIEAINRYSKNKPDDSKPIHFIRIEDYTLDEVKTMIMSELKTRGAFEILKSLKLREESDTDDDRK